MPEPEDSRSTDSADRNARLPRMPSLRTRALKPTRDYWAALHEDGIYQRFTAIDRFHVRLLLQSLDYFHRAETHRERVRWLDLVRDYEHDLGLQSTPPKPEKPRPPRPRPSRSTADSELDALT
ncbi:MAG TPA: hypothetical protein VMB05_14585 [Solirubrobacteraceae bacterium]|nr:hypothetical protein [Solirubrobacteraceae bacterium]